jgi:hypothetical protein
MKRNALPLLLVSMLVMGCSKDIQRVNAPRADAAAPAPLAAGTAKPKPAASPGDIYFIDEYGEVERGGGGSLHAPWWGGPQTVPFGSGVPPEFMLTVARRLTMVRWAVAQMESYGFVRRADLDGAINADTTGTVIIAFQQPGCDPVARQPCIIVHSEAVDGGAITQATGAVYVMNPDSTLSIDDSALSPFVLTGSSPTTSPNPGRPATPARMLNIRDIMGVLIDNAESPSPYTAYVIVMAGTDPCVWKAYFDFTHVALIEASGYAALGAMTTRTWWGGCVGFVAGAMFAEKDWYLRYADGFPCDP